MNEKMRILKMIEDGQITATEAAALLQAVESPAPPPPPPPKSAPPPSGSGFTNNPRPSSHDVGDKINNLAQSIKPGVQKAAEVVAGTIASAANKLSDVLAPDTHSADSPASHTTGSQTHRPTPRPSSPRGGATQETQIELYIEPGSYNELHIAGMGGEVRVKGYNGDKITAKLTYRARTSKAKIDMVKLGGKCLLKYDADDFDLVAIDAYVPERAFSNIEITNMNAPLDASSLSANTMRFNNANGTLNLNNLGATEIYAETSGGEFTAANITADNANFENLNSPLTASETDIAKLQVTTYNAQLAVYMSKFARHREYTWRVETGNDKLNINLPVLPTIGYHIKAHATMSEIKVGLTGLQYIVNEPSQVEAKSVNFNTAAAKINLNVETSNAPLIIN